MTVTVRLTISKQEAEQYQKDYEEFNERSLSLEEVKERMIEMFWADKHEYLCAADIRCDII